MTDLYFSRYDEAWVSGNPQEIIHLAVNIVDCKDKDVLAEFSKKFKLKYNLDNFSIGACYKGFFVRANNLDNSQTIEIYRGEDDPVNLNLGIEYNICLCRMMKKSTREERHLTYTRQIKFLFDNITSMLLNES